MSDGPDENYQVYTTVISIMVTIQKITALLSIVQLKKKVGFFVERWYSYDLRKFKLKVSPIAFNNSFGMFQLLTTGKNVERIGCNEKMFGSSAIRGLVIARLLDVHFTRQC